MKAFLSVLFVCLSGVLIAFFVISFLAYQYPLKYTQQIKTYCNNFHVEEELVASIINVESRYVPTQISSKGAVGLMQIMPSTGKWIADKLGEEFTEESLKEVDTNIKYGCYYLAYLAQQFGNENTVICAYNAGPGNVKAWLKNPEYSVDGVSLHKIPFSETDNYLKKVLKNISYYQKKY